MGEIIAGEDCATWLGSAVPDPSAPFRPPFPVGARPGARFLSRRDLRARILAAARKRIAEVGTDGLQLRPLASECGVSVQSIYNAVGGRDEILRQCAMDWVQSIEHSARLENTPARASGGLAFALLEKFWSSPLLWPQFVVRTTEHTGAVGHPMNEPFIIAAARLLRQAMIEASAHGQVRSTVDVSTLSKQLSISTKAMICHWAENQDNIDQYKRDLLNGPALMLLGAYRDTALVSMENYLDQVHP